ncbi:MAG: DUF4296 domain-containing protein [Muribaculaceae bacterium]|nr:DUF4296 domain-containing protein [Muribaculaceae bacterium]
MTEKSAVGILLAAFVCGGLYSCRKVPENVIQPETMAQLLAELNTGEAYADATRREFSSEDDRKALKQSIYDRYGLTQEDVDTSLSWYGHHIKEYVEVCDRSIEILEHRLIESGNRSAANALAMTGDSVDVWPFPRLLRVKPTSPTRTISFNFRRDENWEPGDIYTWRGKFHNLSSAATWNIVAEYEGGKIETLQTNFSGDGWQEVSFFTDTVGPATRLYGSLTIPDKGGNYVVIDSLSVVRKRFNEIIFPQHYRQRRLYNIDGILHSEADSIS